jgi:hypothetical protein
MKINGEAKGIAMAFVKARAAMDATVSKDAKGNFGKYATLAAIVEATSSHFANNGLAIVQEASADENGIVIETWLVHESGATMQFSPITMPLTDRKPQAVGSAITYGRRYALAAICGLAPDDDDGQSAQDAQSRAQATHKPQAARLQPQQGNHTADVEFRSQRAPVESGPTDEELEVLGTWIKPDDVYTWAIINGACANEHEAKNSFKKVVDEDGGRLTKENIAAVYLKVLRKWNEKIAERPAMQAVAS